MVDIPWSDIANIPERNKANLVSEDKFMILDSEEEDQTKENKITDLEFLKSSLQPKNFVSVSSQDDLEKLFGTNIELPAEPRTILIEESFSSDKPIKYTSLSSFEMFGSTIRNQITYTGPGKMIQPLNPSDIATSMYIHDLILIGNGTNSVIDVKATNSFRMRDIQLINFDNFGILKCPVIDLRLQLGALFKKGLVIVDTETVVISPYNLRQTITGPITVGPTGITLFSFLFGTKRASIKIDAVITDLFANDSVLFFSKNVPPRSFISIVNSDKFDGDLYQVGSKLNIANIVNNGNGKLRITTTTSHNLIEKRPLTLSGFLIRDTYNKADVVLGVPVSTTEFDVDEDFLGNDTSGFVDTASLNTTSPEIDSHDNLNEPDTKAGVEVRTLEPLGFIPIIGTFVPIRKTIPVINDFIQDVQSRQFSTDLATGITTYNGIFPLDSADIIFNTKIIKSTGGGTDTAIIALFINNIKQNKTEKTTTPYSTSASVSVQYNGGLFTINPGDEFDLRMNATSVDSVIATEIKVVIRE